MFKIIFGPGIWGGAKIFGGHCQRKTPVSADFAGNLLYIVSCLFCQPAAV